MKKAIVDFESIQLLFVEKEGTNHKKFFKRFCKIFIANLIDMYPKH